jgi:hypothetical protein
MKNFSEYFYENKLDKLLTLDKFFLKNKKTNKLVIKSKQLFVPDIEDLVILHKLIIKHKITSVMEFGAGYSTIIMAEAIFRNFKKFKFKQRKNCGVHSCETNTKYYNKLKVSKNLKSLIKIYNSNVIMTKFNSRFCTAYKKIPKINPQLIYLDGPDLYSVKNDISNYSTNFDECVPISADILMIEPFLLPGTLIVIDGRQSNVRFLENNFQRKWKKKVFKNIDLTIFVLKEKPLGKVNFLDMKNRNLLNF